MSSTYIELRPEMLEAEGEDSLHALFKAQLTSTLSKCLDMDVWQFDERASVYRVELVSVQTHEDKLSIEYRVSFSAYHGCSDQDYTDSDVRVLRGKLDALGVRFPNYVPPNRRSTTDEL